ncbi:MAG: zinc ribbon domain-containing protein [Acidimicrobiales bacterium]
MSIRERCIECGHTDRDNRKSQAAFVCMSCGYQSNADVNAAVNIRNVVGHTVTGRTDTARSILRMRAQRPNEASTNQSGGGMSRLSGQGKPRPLGRGGCQTLG